MSFGLYEQSRLDQLDNRKVNCGPIQADLWTADREHLDLHSVC